ncbi:ASCH domain-containing protein [Streptomyces sp. NPDC101219]|uniref:ASCH domain-containing protein n=1 Tax=Streptomyces sp. NPDC101219 TaxID=3366131 RepID=UPI00382A8519
MWPRVDGMRALELGAPGEMRARLNSLVLAGQKTATTGLMAEYAEEAEGLEYVGERLALLDDDGRRVATLDVTGVTRCSFADVPWEHALAEGEGDASLDAWRTGHLRFWQGEGATVDDDTPVVCITFRVVAPS